MPRAGPVIPLLNPKELMLAQLVNGVLIGGQYALAAIGLSFMLGVARVVNFAYGAFYMVAAFGTVSILTLLHVPYALASLIAVAGVAILSWPLTQLAVLPVIRRADDNVLISTLAVSIIATNVALQVFGGQVTYIQSPFTELKFTFVGATVSVQQILGSVFAIAIAAALTLYLRRTAFGTRIRAVASNPVLAESSGIDVKRVFLVAVCIGTTIAAVGGVVASPTGVISVFMGDNILLTAFTVAALAGMGRIWGAVIVGFGIGIIENLATIVIAPAYVSALVYGLLVVALLFFPKGLFSGD